VPLLFGAALFGSALLLFVLEPMFARMVLPHLGGSAAVWITCLVFYQGLLLLGYLLAHGAQRLPPRRQLALALGLLAAAALLLPLRVPPEWAPTSPLGGLLLLLATRVGLPFLVLAASSPLLQAWFARSGQARASDPYFLYAASNAGSLVGVFLYPLLLERALTLRQQTHAWTAGYLLVALLTVACAWRSLRAVPAPDRELTGPLPRVEPPPTLRRRLRWLALALCPSSLLLGVTSHLSVNVPPVPLLWALPLGLYLLSFVLCFGRRVRVAHRAMLALQPPLLLAAAAIVFLPTQAPSQLLLTVGLHLAAFFVTAMVCHGELAADRPPAERLTAFYLWVALGGFLGGVVNALLAPVLFTRVLEYPIVLALAVALRPARPGPPATWVQVREGVAVAILAASLLGIFRLPSWFAGVLDGSGWGAALVHRLLPSWLPLSELFYGVLLLLATGLAAWGLSRRPLWLAGGAAAMLIASSVAWRDPRPLLLEARSFHGVHRVHANGPYHLLYHGTTLHGVQGTAPGKRREPLSYFHRGGPLGEIFEQRRGRRLEVGVVGLGTGTIAAYLEPGSRVTFFELDGAVVRIARDSGLFSYLAECQGEVRLVLGDARRSLAAATSPRFDLLIVDAFSSDAIPVHLLTREALRVYLSRLAQQGLLLLHISNRYLSLEPVVASLAKDAGLVVRLEDRDRGRRYGAFASAWAALARPGEGLEPLDWKPLAPAGDHLWTDDRASPIALLKWDGKWDWLLPWRWSSEAKWKAWPPR
jgi:hypothetical protein